ncbi:MAG: hypothetical protein Q9217_003227 [Psora testacea]
MALFRGQEQRQSRAISPAKRGKYNDYDRRRVRDLKTGAPSVKARNKNTFQTSRVEEQPGDVSEHRSETSDTENAEQHEDQLPDSTNQPYNILLQTLKANIQRQGPLQKKRKVERIEAQPEPQFPELALEETVQLEGEVVEDEGPLSGDVGKNETEDQSDPFAKHLTDVEGEGELSKKIADIKGKRWQIWKGPKQAKWTYSYRHPASMDVAAEEWAQTSTGVVSLGLKERLKAPATKALPLLDPLTGHVASSISKYLDVFFPLRTLENADTLRKLACLHTLNHIVKTRDKIIKNNARLAKDEGADLELRDQGFTRPKVLILLPTRQSCVRYVDTLMALCDPEQQENKKKFQDIYASGEVQFSDDKPADFRELFAGNDDDMFRLGMKFTRKTVKYFSKFHNSDIIFASPLGLRMALGADDIKQQNHDFLSSIEVLVIDQADALLMQNWEHIEYTFEKLNLQPKEAHGCDFSRVRNWYLDGDAKYLRQTIVFSAFNFPSSNRLYIQHMLNIDGKVKYSREEGGAMIGMGISPKQTFSRFDFMAATTEPDDRFKYFSTAIVPSLRKGSRRGVESGSGVLIYLPAYADFVRIRNYLATSSATQDISFGSISEYTSVRDVARARSHFLSGRHSVLLYTERAHHFRRYHLKGVKRIVMYGLPENPVFYKEVVGGFFEASIAAAKVDAREASVRALFSKLDMLKLERIVGSAKFMMPDSGASAVLTTGASAADSNVSIPFNTIRVRNPTRKLKDNVTHLDTSLVMWRQPQSGLRKGSLPDPNLCRINGGNNAGHRRPLSDEETSKLSPQRCRTPASEKNDGKMSDNSELPIQGQTVKNSISRPSSIISVANSEAYTGHYVDDGEILRRISRLLHSPVTSTSEQLTCPNGKPVGVEVAINEYQRGEYSTRDLDQDLLPRGLHPRHMEYLSSRYYGDKHIIQPNGFSDLHSLYAAATDRNSIAFTETESLLMDTGRAEEYGSGLSSQKVIGRIESGSMHSHSSHDTFDEFIRTNENMATANMGDGVVPHDHEGSQPRNVLQAGQEAPQPNSWFVRRAHTFYRPSTLHLQSRPQIVSCAHHEKIPFGKVKPPRPLPITPERYQMLRLQLPQPYHVSTASCSSCDQSHIHPALRMPITDSPLGQVFKDGLDGDGPVGRYQLPSWSSSEAAPSLANLTQLDDRSVSPSVSTIPTSAPRSPLERRSEEQQEQRLLGHASEAPAHSENYSGIERNIKPSLYYNTKSSPVAYSSSIRSNSSRRHSHSVVEDSYRAVTKFRETAVEESCPSDSIYSLKRMLADTETDKDAATHIGAATRELLSPQSPFESTVVEAQKAHTPQAGEALSGTMLGGSFSKSSRVVEIPTLPRYAPTAFESEPRSRRRRFAYLRRPRSATTVADETYLRAKTYLHCQPTPLTIQPTAAKTRMTLPSYRPVSHTSTKLARFFGEDYIKGGNKGPRATQKDKEHEQMVRQLLGRSKRRLSGVSEDVKHGLKRLLG